MQERVHDTSVRPGRVLAVLEDSTCIEGAPYAVRVFRVDGVFKTTHLDTIVVREKKDVLGAIEKHGVGFYADLSLDGIPTAWKAPYLGLTPVNLADINAIMQECFGAIRASERNPKHMGLAEEKSEQLRVALGQPTWAEQQADGFVPQPVGFQTPAGPIYGSPAALAYILKCIEGNTDVEDSHY